jgi:methylmalonyl-CoA mutase
VDNIGFKTEVEGVNAAIEANADIVVICSSDDEYAAFAPEACKLLQTKKPEMHFIVAGNPTAIIEELKKAGVDDFIHVRTNVIETLRKYNALLGI